MYFTVFLCDFAVFQLNVQVSQLSEEKREGASRICTDDVIAIPKIVKALRFLFTKLLRVRTSVDIPIEFVLLLFVIKGVARNYDITYCTSVGPKFVPDRRKIENHTHIGINQTSSLLIHQVSTSRGVSYCSSSQPSCAVGGSGTCSSCCTYTSGLLNSLIDRSSSTNLF